MDPIKRSLHKRPRLAGTSLAERRQRKIQAGTGFVIYEMVPLSPTSPHFPTDHPPRRRTENKGWGEKGKSGRVLHHASPPPSPFPVYDVHWLPLLPPRKPGSEPAGQRAPRESRAFGKRSGKRGVRGERSRLFPGNRMGKKMGKRRRFRVCQGIDHVWEVYFISGRTFLRGTALDIVAIYVTGCRSRLIGPLRFSAVVLSVGWLSRDACCLRRRWSDHFPWMERCKRIGIFVSFPFFWGVGRKGKGD